MKKISPKLFVEAIGLICIIGSLIFVGLEQRQNTIAIRAATNSSFATGFQDLNLVVASSPSLAKALAKLGGNPDDISQEDRIQVLGLYRALFHIWSNAHRQYLNGTLDPALYDGVTQEISTYAKKTPGTEVLDANRRHLAIKWAWESEKFIYNPEFQQLMDSILSNE
ncbi:MAG: hypothetical protein COB38_13485 [Gammaproteobacteria bacterium]|nr:MAG: hypothetical protein COB38_13485 [Gammaproteobacteria bacterium]